MLSAHTPASSTTRLARIGVFAAVLGIALATYAVPFLGFLLSMTLPVVTDAARRHLWPTVSRRTSLVCSMLVWVGLWLPAIVGFFIPLLGVEISTTWLIIPLCGPDTPAAWFLPALTATAVVTLGLAATMVLRRPWALLAAAWLAPWVHHAVMSSIPHEFVC